MVDAYATALVVRALHVVAGTLLLGGPLVVLGLVLARSGGSHTLLDAAVVHEWLAWPALALLVLSGVGNLGALGPAVPPLDTSWGGRFALKLALVLLLLVVSAARTLGVVRARVGGTLPRTFAAWTFGLTTALAATAMVTAVSLAHG